MVQQKDKEPYRQTHTPLTEDLKAIRKRTDADARRLREKGSTWHVVVGVDNSVGYNPPKRSD